MSWRVGVVRCGAIGVGSGRPGEKVNPREAALQAMFCGTPGLEG